MYKKKGLILFVFFIMFFGIVSAGWWSDYFGISGKAINGFGQEDWVDAEEYSDYSTEEDYSDVSYNDYSEDYYSNRFGYDVDAVSNSVSYEESGNKNYVVYNGEKTDFYIKDDVVKKSLGTFVPSFIDPLVGYVDEDDEIVIFEEKSKEVLVEGKTDIYDSIEEDSLMGAVDGEDDYDGIMDGIEEGESSLDEDMNDITYEYAVNKLLQLGFEEVCNVGVDNIEFSDADFITGNEVKSPEECGMIRHSNYVINEQADADLFNKILEDGKFVIFEKDLEIKADSSEEIHIAARSRARLEIRGSIIQKGWVSNTGFVSIGGEMTGGSIIIGGLVTSDTRLFIVEDMSAGSISIGGSVTGAGYVDIGSPMSGGSISIGGSVSGNNVNIGYDMSAGSISIGGSVTSENNVNIGSSMLGGLIQIKDSIISSKQDVNIGHSIRGGKIIIEKNVVSMSYSVYIGQFILGRDADKISISIGGKVEKSVAFFVNRFLTNANELEAKYVSSGIKSDDKQAEVSIPAPTTEATPESTSEATPEAPAEVTPEQVPTTTPFLVSENGNLLTYEGNLVINGKDDGNYVAMNKALRESKKIVINGDLKITGDFSGEDVVLIKVWEKGILEIKGDVISEVDIILAIGTSMSSGSSISIGGLVTSENSLSIGLLMSGGSISIGGSVKSGNPVVIGDGMKGGSISIGGSVSGSVVVSIGHSMSGGSISITKDVSGKRIFIGEKIGNDVNWDKIKVEIWGKISAKDVEGSVVNEKWKERFVIEAIVESVPLGALDGAAAPTTESTSEATPEAPAEVTPVEEAPEETPAEVTPAEAATTIPFAVSDNGNLLTHDGDLVVNGKDDANYVAMNNALKEGKKVVINGDLKITGDFSDSGENKPFIGAENKGVLEIKGDVISEVEELVVSIGHSMSDGNIIITGSVIGGDNVDIGNSMSGGSISIGGSVTSGNDVYDNVFIGYSMTGGSISIGDSVTGVDSVNIGDGMTSGSSISIVGFVESDMGVNIGMSMSGGSISIGGSVKNGWTLSIGYGMKGGSISIGGLVTSSVNWVSIGMYMEGGSISITKDVSGGGIEIGKKIKNENIEKIKVEIWGKISAEDVEGSFVNDKWKDVFKIEAIGEATPAEATTTPSAVTVPNSMTPPLANQQGGIFGQCNNKKGVLNVEGVYFLTDVDYKTIKDCLDVGGTVNLNAGVVVNDNSVKFLYRMKNGVLNVNDGATINVNSMAEEMLGGVINFNEGCSIKSGTNIGRIMRAGEIRLFRGINIADDSSVRFGSLKKGGTVRLYIKTKAD